MFLLRSLLFFYWKITATSCIVQDWRICKLHYDVMWTTQYTCKPRQTCYSKGVHKILCFIVGLNPHEYKKSYMYIYMYSVKSLDRPLYINITVNAHVSVIFHCYNTCICNTITALSFLIAFKCHAYWSIIVSLNHLYRRFLLKAHINNSCVNLLAKNHKSSQCEEFSIYLQNTNTKVYTDSVKCFMGEEFI